jgi:hypothetical protein
LSQFRFSFYARSIDRYIRTEESSIEEAVAMGIDLRLVKTGNYCSPPPGAVELRHVEFVEGQVRLEVRAAKPVKIRVRNNPARDFPAGLIKV